MELDVWLVGSCLVLGFFTVLFLQSGLDKVVDWKGNLSYLTEHFSTSPLKGVVPMLLATVTVFELLTALACAFGIVVLATGGSTVIASGAIELAMLTFVMLFAGQRIAKDYAGAATIAIYMGVAIGGVLLINSRF